MKLYQTLTFTAGTALFLIGCAANLTMKKTPGPIGAKLGEYRTVAYAEVNSPKQDGEIYLIKSGPAFQEENGIYRMNLDPANFKNAYSFVELSFAGVKGGNIQKLQILVQGENFSDGYRTKDLASDKALVFECDGKVAHLKYQGLAESRMNGLGEVMDMNIYFEIPEVLWPACKP
jgi:hypothetical protein